MPEPTSGPHEMQPVPLVSATQGLFGRLDRVPRRLRNIPIESLGVLGRIVPGGVLRRPIVLTEAVLRQLLGVDENSEHAESTLYPGDAGRIDEDFTAPPDPRTSVRSMVHEMLDRSVRQSPRQAEEANFKRLLTQLVPDEVRIINALSDGRISPIIHVGVGSPGSVDHTVYRNASTIGTDAGVRLPDAVSQYIEHLESLNLVEIGPAEDALREQYEILETYDEIESADEFAAAEAKGTFAKKLKFKSEKHVRHTLRISELGAKLWAAANPDTYDFQVPDRRGNPKNDGN